jgi:hypothetical protein
MSSEQMKANGSLLHNKQHPLHACMQKPLVNQVSHGDPLHLHNHNAEASQETLTSISIQHSVDPSYMRCRASLRYSYSVVLLSSWKLPTDRLNYFTPFNREKRGSSSAVFSLFPRSISVRSSDFDSTQARKPGFILFHALPVNRAEHWNNSSFGVFRA